MKKKPSLTSAFFEPRVFISFVLLLGAVLLTLGAFGVSPATTAKAESNAPVSTDEAARPDVVHMVGPFSEDRNLNDIPYIAPREKEEEVRLMRHPQPLLPSGQTEDPIQVVKDRLAAVIAMPTPIATFAGMTSAQACGTCLPPDTHGDVGPNHYIQSVNSSIRSTVESPNRTAARLSSPVRKRSCAMSS